MKHGTAYAYRHGGCRCDTCREAHAATQRAYRERKGPGDRIAEGLLSDLLNELCPAGLTDDCPARRTA